MAGALFGAYVADIGAGFASQAGQLATSPHVAGRQAADRSAVDVELDAASHGLHVLLVEARGGTVVAGKRASVAGVDAGLKLCMWHEEFSRANPAPSAPYSRSSKKYSQSGSIQQPLRWRAVESLR